MVGSKVEEKLMGISSERLFIDLGGVLKHSSIEIFSNTRNNTYVAWTIGDFVRAPDCNMRTAHRSRLR